MKKILLATLALAIAAPAFAGNKAPAAPAPASLVDSSGKAVTTEAAQPIAIAQMEPVAAPAPAPKKTVAKKSSAHKKAAHKPAAKKTTAQ